MGKPEDAGEQVPMSHPCCDQLNRGSCRSGRLFSGTMIHKHSRVTPHLNDSCGKLTRPLYAGVTGDKNDSSTQWEKAIAYEPKRLMMNRCRACVLQMMPMYVDIDDSYGNPHLSHADMLTATMIGCDSILCRAFLFHLNTCMMLVYE